MHILTLTTRQRRRLERQLRSTADARVYRRTLALLEVGGGEPVAAVAARLRVTARVIYRWVETYTRDHDPAALRDRDRAGRPRRRTARGREVLGELLRRSPQEVGGFATAWTVPLLHRQLAAGAGRRGEKSGPSAGGFAGSRPARSSWPRTRRTCSCSRRCGRAGPRGAGPRRSP